MQKNTNKDNRRGSDWEEYAERIHKHVERKERSESGGRLSGLDNLRRISAGEIDDCVG